MIAGLDYRPALWARTGIGRYVRELCRALAEGLDAADDTVIKLYGDCLRRRGTEPGEAALPPSPFVERHARRIPARLSRWLAARRGGLARRLGGVELFHTTDYVELPLGELPRLATIHDLAFLHDERYHGPERSAHLERVTRALTDGALGVITHCEFSAAEVAVHLGFPPGRIHVAPLGADHALRLAGPPEPESAGGAPTVLSLGTLEPRKNHLRCLRAIERLVREGVDLRWVVIGARGWGYEPFLEALERSPASARIELVSRPLADREVMRRLRSAEVLLYPSLHEGFGLPVVEAMALSTAVLSSAVSATAEIAGAAALLVDPLDEDAIHAGLRTLLREREERERLVHAGRERAAHYTWSACATRTLAAYRSALSRADHRRGGRLF